MKNNTLKKLGAVALAAVMAVTFAPVSALQAFAANTNVNSDNEITTNGAEIDTAGSYTVTNTVTGAGITVSLSSGTVWIDLKGKSANLKVTGTGAKVIVENSKKPKKAESYPTLTITGNETTKADGGYITLSGNMILDRASIMSRTSDETLTTVYASMPSATVGDTINNANLNVGQAAIDKVDDADDVYAYSGSVEVKELADGKWARVADKAQPYTKITAAPEKGSTLQTYTTVYGFSFNLTNTKGYVSKDSTTYTDVRYYGGYDAPANGFAATTHSSNPISKQSDMFRAGGVAMNWIEGYVNNGSTVTVTSVDDAETSDGYAFGDDVKDDEDYVLPKNAADHYYPFDPQKTGYLKKTDALIIVDGTKYCVTNDTKTTVDPSETLEIVKTEQKTDKLGENESSVKLFDSQDNQEYVTDAPLKSIKAPAEMTVTAYVTKTVSGNDIDYHTVINAFGADAKNKGLVNPGATLTDVAEETLNVAQVSSKLTRTVEYDSIGKGVKIAHGDDVAFFRLVTTGVNGDYDYFFGTIPVATEEFRDRAQNKTVTGDAVARNWDNQVVYASKEIKTSVGKVPMSVTFIGEVSATVTATDAASGTRTWLINGAVDVNTPQNVYRFRNVKTGDHLYTMVQSEIQSLITSPDWELENSNAFKVLPWNTTVEGAVKVLRFRNKNTGEYLYSTDPAEQARLYADPSWEEGYAAFAGVTKDTGYAVYRVRYAGGHVYCTSKTNEVYPLIGSGKGYELDGTVFFATDTPEKEK